MPALTKLFRAAMRRITPVFSFRPESRRRSAPPLPALLLLLLLSGLAAAPQALAFETLRQQDAPGVTSQWTTSSPPPVAGGDKCLHLLKSFHIDHNATAMDRDRRSAGNAAAVGLVFGLRFALGPVENRKSGGNRNAPRLDIWQPGIQADPQALAIADYRRCKNDEALRLLNEEWRWSR